MTGQISRFGFRYQDLYLLRLVLEKIKDELISKINNTANLSSQLKFGVEAEVGQKDWDILIIKDKKHELIEVKSGEVTKDDRKTFWLRLRKELNNSGNKPEEIYPILVISDPTITAYNEIKSLSQKTNFDGIKIPTQEINRISSDESLVEEALYWLSGVTIESKKNNKDQEIKKDHGITVPEITAKKALSRFSLREIPKDKLESELENAISLLGTNIEEKVIRQQLEGWLSNKAVLKENEKHFFTIQDLKNEVSLLKKFIDLSPEVIKEAGRIKGEYAKYCVETWKNKINDINGLKKYDLAEIQTKINSIDWEIQSSSKIILGESGSGKSISLFELYNKISKIPNTEIIPFFIKDLKTDLFKNAIEVLTNLSLMNNKKVFILADGLDEISPKNSEKILHILDILRISSNIVCIASCKKVDWESRSKLREQAKQWDSIELNEWETKIIENEIKDLNLKDNVSQGLKQLLHNPFYLDLFIRTFKDSKISTITLQTRHELLKSFWETKVISDDKFERIDLLSKICDSFSKSDNWIPKGLSNKEQQNLYYFISTGLFFNPNARGSIVFRHPLLRDFAMSQWLLSNEDLETISKKLIATNKLNIRFGMLRALVELLLDEVSNDYSTEIEFIDFVKSTYLYSKELGNEIADILGMLSPTSKLDILEIAKETDSSFIVRVINSAKLNINTAWVKEFSKFSFNNSLVYSKNLLDEEIFKSLFCYLDVLYRQSSQNIDLTRIAIILREWSVLDKFKYLLNESNRYFMYHLIPLIVKILPNEATIEWIENEVNNSSWMTKNAIIDSLIIFEESISQEEIELHNRLKNILPNILKLVSEKEDVQNIIIEHAIDYCLFNSPQNNKGLIDNNTEVYFSVALDLLDKVIETNYSKDFTELKDLIDDRPKKYWFNANNDDRIVSLQYKIKLQHYLYKKIIELFKNDNKKFIDFYLPLLKNSKSATIQTFLFQIFLEVENGNLLEEYIKEMLFDERIYFCIFGFYYFINEALLKLWSSFSPNETTSFFKCMNIIKNSDEGKIIAGAFLSKLPFKDIPEEFKALIRDYKNELEEYLDNPREKNILEQNLKNILRNDLKSILLKDIEPLGLWDNEQEEKINMLYDLHKELITSQKVDLNFCLAHVTPIIPILQQNSEKIIENPWVLKCFKGIFRHLRNEICHNQEILENITEIQFKVLDKIIGSENFNENIMNLSLDLLCETFSFKFINANSKYIDDYFNLISKAISENNHISIKYLIEFFNYLRISKINTQQMGLLKNFILLIEKYPYIASCVPWDFFYLLETEYVKDIIDKLLKSNITNIKFYMDLLDHLIYYSLFSEDNKRKIFLPLVINLLDNTNNISYLKEPKNQYLLINELPFNLKQRIKNNYPNTDLIPIYSNLINKVWEIWISLPSKYFDHNRSLMLSTFYWIGKISESNEKIKLWWNELYPLLISGIEVGSVNEIEGILFSLNGISSNFILTEKQLIEISEKILSKISININGNNKFVSCAEHLSGVLGDFYDKKNCSPNNLNKYQDLFQNLSKLPINNNKTMFYLNKIRLDLESN